MHFLKSARTENKLLLQLKFKNYMELNRLLYIKRPKLFENEHFVNLFDRNVKEFLNRFM